MSMAKPAKKEKNNAISFKRKRNGKVIVDTKNADIVDITVSAVNSYGGLEVTKFTKEKSFDSIKQIAMAKDYRNSQNYKARNGGFKEESKNYYNYDSTKKKKSLFSKLKRKEGKK